MYTKLSIFTRRVLLIHPTSIRHLYELCIIDHTFDVSRCCISLRHVLRCCPSLHSLTVNFEVIRDSALQVIGQFTTLHVLNIYSDDNYNVTYQGISNMLQSLKQLRELRTNWRHVCHRSAAHTHSNSDADDNDMQHMQHDTCYSLAIHNPELHTLALYGKHGVSVLNCSCLTNLSHLAHLTTLHAQIQSNLNTVIALFSLPSLQYLLLDFTFSDVYENILIELVDAMPYAFQKLKKLSFFGIDNVSFNDAVIDAINRAIDLTSLDISAYKLTSAGIEAFANHKQNTLQTLRIHGNRESYGVSLLPLISLQSLQHLEAPMLSISECQYLLESLPKLEYFSFRLPFSECKSILDKRQYVDQLNRKRISLGMARTEVWFNIVR
jgi:hypothetical protein